MKSFSLCFKPNQIKIKPPNLALREKVIPSVDKCKYLGIIISVKNEKMKMRWENEMRKYYMQMLICSYVNLVIVHLM